MARTSQAERPENGQRQFARRGGVAQHSGAEEAKGLLRRVQHLDQGRRLVVVMRDDLVERRKARVPARVRCDRGRD